MLDNIVTVKSKTINNDSFPIVFNIIERRIGEGDDAFVDKRELSRSFVFQNFESKIPLQYAKMLVKKNPKEFTIVGAENEESDEIKEVIRKSKEASKGFKCLYCDFKAKSKLGLVSHTRHTHPKEYKEAKDGLRKQNDKQ